MPEFKHIPKHLDRDTAISVANLILLTTAVPFSTAYLINIPPSCKELKILLQKLSLSAPGTPAVTHSQLDMFHITFPLPPAICLASYLGLWYLFCSANCTTMLWNIPSGSAGSVLTFLSKCCKIHLPHLSTVNFHPV